MKTSAKEPSKGWTLKKGDGLFEVIICSGSAQFNQTNPGDYGYKVFNWGGGSNTSDTGCRYLVVYDGMITGLNPIEGIETGAEVVNGCIYINGSSNVKVYGIDGRSYNNKNLEKGIYIATDEKRRTFKVNVK